MAVTHGIELDERTHARLTQLGKRHERPLLRLMRTAILEYLDREEQYERRGRRGQSAVGESSTDRRSRS